MVLRVAISLALALGAAPVALRWGAPRTRAEEHKIRSIRDCERPNTYPGTQTLLSTVSLLLGLWARLPWPCARAHRELAASMGGRLVALCSWGPDRVQLAPRSITAEREETGWRIPTTP